MTEYLMEQDIAIELTGVKITRRRRKTIGPINLRIPQGHIVALVGPNGSGKSTIINMILQTISPDEGSITWLGETSKTALPLEIRQQIAYVPEHPINEENFMTADEAARFRSHWYPNWDEVRFDQLMSRFEVSRHERLNRLSKGERRKFEIAAAFAAKPKILLLDEPSSGLDPFAWKDMIEQLRCFMEGEDVTVILSSHIVEEVKRLADYIVLVNSGQVLGMAEKDALFANWKEIWVRGELEGLDGLEADILRRDYGPAMTKLIVRESEALELWQHENRIQMVKSRSLELDEILEIWIQGHTPDVLSK
ncbi:ABC-2 type transport system ATP-binding protein [Fontibacillus panacisegetis]|uniref:ABC-2 type transport system ATP-binding protein n=1 Tax=Fontibacillus panacisegetis TaxID=670482 RepID=A0A1G7SCB6_9BACL|nr:ABC transporter ATP-binding protein [Fontibacillus panacisegetis]SDG20079.1 ABC-2 type transport system ATP-binding protein [Fontibacillus panacisegetis]